MVLEVDKPVPWRIRRLRAWNGGYFWQLLLWDKMYECYSYWRAFTKWQEVIDYLDYGWKRRGSSDPTKENLPKEHIFP